MGMLPGLCGVVQGILVVRRGNEASISIHSSIRH